MDSRDVTSDRLLYACGMLQERIDVLEDLLHEERMLSGRNAMQAIRFQKTLEKISKLHQGALSFQRTCATIASETLAAEVGQGPILDFDEACPAVSHLHKTGPITTERHYG